MILSISKADGEIFRVVESRIDVSMLTSGTGALRTRIGTESSSVSVGATVDTRGFHQTWLVRALQWRWMRLFPPKPVAVMNGINAHRTCTWDKVDGGTFLFQDKAEPLYKTYAPFLECFWKEGHLWARCKIRLGLAAWCVIWAKYALCIARCKPRAHIFHLLSMFAVAAAPR